MTTRVGLDFASAPVASTIQRMLADVGGDFVVVYIGGAWVAGVARATWTPALVRDLATLGVRSFAPTYVPAQDGSGNAAADAADCDAQMRRFGWGPGAPVWLDIEAPTSQAMIAYAERFNAAIRARGYLDGDYGLPWVLAQEDAAGAGRPQQAWFTNWVQNALLPGPDPATMPGFNPAVYAGVRMWQYTLGGHSLEGTSVDADTAESTVRFAGTPGTFGPGANSLGDDDMLYVGPFHAVSATFQTFGSAGTVYHDPSTSALSIRQIAPGSSVAVTGYLFSSSGEQSSDRGAGAGAGIDLVWWKLADGTGWLNDNVLVTVGVAGLPEGTALSSLPAGVTTYFATTIQAAPDDDSAFATHAEVKAVADAVAAIKVPTTGTIAGPITVKLG